MRVTVGIFGLVCGAIVVALVARYGFKTTDIEADAWIMAFLFGVIATFGLAGHAVAVRLWKHNRAISLIAGVVAFGALGINLSNSLGAIAGRSDAVTTERIEHNRAVRAAEAEHKRLTELRSSMSEFVEVDAGAVEAAKRAADAATQSREAECKKRGNLCRDREADEREATDKLAKASANHAASERARQIEAQIAEQRAKLAKLGGIQTVNAQGSAMARLFRLPDDEAGYVAVAQQFAMAALVELIILVCLISWEAMAPAPSARREDEAGPPLTAGEVIAKNPSPSAGEVERLPPPPRPRLVAAKKEPPAGPVPQIMTDALEPAKGQRVQLEAAYVRYASECKVSQREPVEPDVFMDALARFCKVTKIRTKLDCGRLYLLDVQLVNKAVMTVDTTA